MALEKMSFLPWTAAALSLHSMCTRSSSDASPFCARSLNPINLFCLRPNVAHAGRSLLRLIRLMGHGHRASCTVEAPHALLNSARRRSCSHALRHWLSLSPFLVLKSNLCRRFAFSGLSHILLPNLTVSGVEAALAYMVGLARAYSVMHANASSGRPRHEETAPTTLPHPALPLVQSSVIPAYIPSMALFGRKTANMNGWN